MLPARLDSLSMPLPEELQLRTAGADDLQPIADLRASVGWAAHDWALRAAIEAPHARSLVASDARGAVVGVGSGIVYGALGFVGNMVVAEGYRRRGIGAAILESVLTFLEDRGCARIELYATQVGRPLYAGHGFAPTGPSAVAQVDRGIDLGATSGLVVTEAEPPAIEVIAAYDAPRFGGDRSSLLGMMVADPARPLLVAMERGAPAGYAWLRPDGPRLGPFVADAPVVAAALLAEAFERAPGADALALNLPLANRAGTAWLSGLGVALEPWDGRMARGPQIARRDDTIYGNVVGALG